MFKPRNNVGLSDSVQHSIYLSGLRYARNNWKRRDCPFANYEEICIWLDGYDDYMIDHPEEDRRINNHDDSDSVQTSASA